MTYFNVAIENLKNRFDVKLKNICELKSDSISIKPLGYLIDNKIYLIAPTKAKFRKNNLPQGKPIGELVEIDGNFQCKKYANIKKLNLPAIILKKDNTLYFNGEPFSNFQKWLQFEYSIVPYINWYDRMFWLDEYGSFLLNLIYKIAPTNIYNFISNHLPKINIILRHDVDDSRDLTYLDFEKKNNIPATYAILLDKNLKFWIDNLKNQKNIEIAFHFFSNKITINDYLKYIINKFLKMNLKIENLPINWKKQPLYKQVKKFYKKTRIMPSTIHRHFSFIKYPEFINELEKLNNIYPTLIGSSSFFRSIVLFNNLKCANGIGSGYYHFEPDVGSPFWWVFKLYNPISKNMVNLYEQSHIMEPNIELLEQMFSKKIKGIKKYLFTIGLHPAHANNKLFNRNGQIDTLKKLFNLKEKYQLRFYTYKDFLERNIL